MIYENFNPIPFLKYLFALCLYRIVYSLGVVPVVFLTNQSHCPMIYLQVHTSVQVNIFINTCIQICSNTDITTGTKFDVTVPLTFIVQLSHGLVSTTTIPAQVNIRCANVRLCVPTKCVRCG